MTLQVHVLPRLRRVPPVTLAYLAALTAVGVVLSLIGERWQDVVVAATSTNLHNLSQMHLSVLASSAFVINEGPVWFTCVGVGLTLAVAELAWGGRRMLTTFVLGHLGATTVVAVGLWVGISSGWLPPIWERASDVGVSYGVFAVLTGLTFSLPRGWRIPWAAVWVTLALQAVLIDRSFTSVGHLTAGLVGLSVAWWAMHRSAAEPTSKITGWLPLTLLTGAALFGLCIVGWGSGGWWSAPVMAMVVVLASVMRPVQSGLLHLSCDPRPRDASPTEQAASAVDAVPDPTDRPFLASRRQ